MTDKTISAYQGYGHRVQLIRREDVERSWAVMDNRRVQVSTRDESFAKNVFLNIIAGIVHQYAIQFPS